MPELRMGLTLGLRRLMKRDTVLALRRRMPTARTGAAPQDHEPRCPGRDSVPACP